MCGAHGGEPNSVKWCQRRGLEEVSCSLLSIRIARVAPAQAAAE